MHTLGVTEDRRVLFRNGPPPNHVITYGSHPDQICDVYDVDVDARRRNFPIVFLHGGYWRPEYDRMHARSAAGALAKAGWRTALVEYRRTPGDPDVTVSDVLEAIRCASRFFDDSRVVLVGHSAGGHLALLAGQQSSLPVHAIVALAPVSNLTLADEWDLDDGAVRLFLGSPATARPDLDPRQLPHPGTSVSIIHGIEDTIVPEEMSEEYGRHVGVPVTAIPQVGHYELIDPLSSTWPELSKQLESVDQIRG